MAEPLIRPDFPGGFREGVRKWQASLGNGNQLKMPMRLASTSQLPTVIIAQPFDTWLRDHGNHFQSSIKIAPPERIRLALALLCDH